jgi:hypothetical protein
VRSVDNNFIPNSTTDEDAGALRNPVNQVIGVLDRDVDTKELIGSLHAAGFSEDSIGVLAGRKDTHKLDSSSGSETGI